MRIEFMGISGVGKTTICKELIEHYKNNEIAYSWSRYELYENNNWLFRNIKKMLYIMRTLYKEIGWCKTVFQIIYNEDISIFGKITLLFNCLSLKSFIINDEKSNLLDEGVFQLIWATYMRKNEKTSTELIEKFFSIFDVPDKLIVIEANDIIIEKRLNERNRKTYILSQDNVLECIQQMKRVEDMIINFVIAENLIDRDQIIYIDNNERV